MTEVRLEGLVKRHPGGGGVDGVDLRVAPGRLTALLGPSGCGKTTTLRTIAGLEAPDGGRVLIGGRDVAGTPVRERGVGLVFQRYALFPHMDVAGNVGFGLRVRRLPRAEAARRLDAILDVVRLAHLRDRYPAQLSGGQMQRVALARTLVTEPRVLMLDEPLTNLDAGLRAEMRGFVRDLQRRLAITTIVVTHDQAEAMELADRVAVMLAGRIAQEGSPDALYRRPESRAVANFMGAANVFPATRAGPGAVRTAFATLRAAAPPGGAFDVMLRAEAIDMAPEGAAAPDDAFAGHVEARTFQGASVAYAVRCGADLLTVSEPSRRLVDPGTPVRLSIEPDRVWTIPAP